MPVGPAEFPGTFLGPVISKPAQDRILKLIQAGRAEAQLAWQGDVPADTNACYVPPTIFSHVSSSSFLFREEIFGPVLAVTQAKDFDQHLQIRSVCPFCLRSLSHVTRRAFGSSVQGFVQESTQICVRPLSS